ncbi:hypothetical protein DYB35_007419 [Aphanomyces astaci]|uniref:Kinesin motor domain-containing protein n=2 Tax=Aphanomyces astaci TaxID=112090 RepID=A0A418CT74_APHAT|nr:hypothetical protein DYB35_007419 [Aphanomyces astaci]
MPPLRAIDSKGRIDQMDKYIRKLKYRLRELKMQRDAFSLACQGIERDLTDEHAATARAYATAKQELLHVSSRGSDDVARCGDRRGSAGEPSGPVDPSPSSLLLHPSSSKEVSDNEEEDQSVLKTLDSNMQEFVRNAMERSTSQMVAKYQALLAEKEHAQEAQLQTLREYYTHSMSSTTADAWATVTQLQAQTKALETDKTSLGLEFTQLKIDHAALKEELQDFQERVRLQDEENTSAKSFWQKSTDMIKENRRLTEEIVHLTSEVAKAHEVIAAKEAAIAALQVSVHELEVQSKGMDDEKRVWSDRLTTVEVAQHQMTQDNTAMYAQMMAMQTGCDARLEQMKAQYEHQRRTYVDEVKMLQMENRVMTRHTRPPAEVVEDKGELEKLSADFLEVRTQLATQMEYVAELERQVHDGMYLTLVVGNLEVSDFIQSAIDGYHVCIFAYGQTGSGKTFTIMGCCSTLGEQGWSYSLEVTFMEIYNETIRDLLSPSDPSVKYSIRTDKQGKNYVENLRRFPISLSEGVDQVELIMETAACNRSVEKTDMNAESSRSHSIFTLHLHGRRTDDDDAADVDLLGSLSLVDLGMTDEKGALISRTKHCVLTSSHPSPLGATKTAEPFIGSKCFSKANAYLASHNKPEIDWTL